VKRVTRKAYERDHPDQALRFGPFVLLPSERILLEGGQALRIGDRALEILILLLQRAGQVVTKEELIARAWPNTIVEAINLRVNIAALRRVLRDGTPPNRFIVNVVGQGYAFVAETHAEDGSGSPEIALALKGSRKHHLPAPQIQLIGRSADVGRLTALVRSHRLVTIVGAGGVGKTVLAIEVASALRSSYKNGVHFIDLSSIGDAARIADSCAAALELAVSRQKPTEDLIAYLERKDILLVIDNCEHLIEAAAEVIERILQRATKTHVLATSREPLSAHNECLHPLAALDFPATGDGMTAALAKRHSAVQVFERRATTSVSTFEITDSNAAAISHICRQLDGNPLAIELAAARVSLLGVHELASHLGERFFSITNGRRTSVPRHYTLRATLDWSYALLGSTAQLVLQRLAILNGAFTARAAATLAAHRGLCARDVLTAVTSLAAKSLVVTDTSVDPPRHRLLYMTRVYALEKLSKSDDWSVASRWHCEYAQTLLRHAEMDWDTTSRLEWVNKYAFAVDDIRAAIDWAFSPSGEPILGAELTAAAVPFGFQLGLMDEFRERVEQALSCLDQLPDRQPIIETRLRAAFATMSLNPPDEQHRIKIVNANEASATAGAARYQVSPLVTKAIDHIVDGNYHSALLTARQLGSVAARTGDPLASLLSERVLAQAHHFYGDHRTARRLLEQVLENAVKAAPLAYASAQTDRRVTMRIVLARILWLQGLSEQAVTIANESLEYAASDCPTALCQSLALAACPIAFWRGDQAAAQRLVANLIEQATRFRQEQWLDHGHCYARELVLHNRRGGATDAIRNSPSPCCSKGLIADTLATIGSTIIQAGQLSAPISTTVGWCAPEIARVRGEALRKEHSEEAAAGAETLFEQSMQIARRQGALAWQLRTATSLATLWRDQGQEARARQLLASIYNQFLEGHGTRDLREARSLLETLP